MDEKYRQLLKIPCDRLDAINAILLDSDQRVIEDFLNVVDRYGTPDEINYKYQEARRLSNLLKKVQSTKPEYIQDLEWLAKQRDNNAFVSVAEYRRKVLGDKADKFQFNEDFAVTLEVSALQYFPWICAMTDRALVDLSLIHI